MCNVARENYKPALIEKRMPITSHTSNDLVVWCQFPLLLNPIRNRNLMLKYISTTCIRLLIGNHVKLMFPFPEIDPMFKGHSNIVYFISFQSIFETLSLFLTPPYISVFTFVLWRIVAPPYYNSSVKFKLLFYYITVILQLLCEMSYRYFSPL